MRPLRSNRTARLCVESITSSNGATFPGRSWALAAVSLEGGSGSGALVLMPSRSPPPIDVLKPASTPSRPSLKQCGLHARGAYEETSDPQQQMLGLSVSSSYHLIAQCCVGGSDESPHRYPPRSELIELRLCVTSVHQRLSVEYFLSMPHH